MIERFDLELGIEGLDLESTMALIELQGLWSARRRLRERWTLRAEFERRAL